jgi:type IV secretory pathway VirB10-like protein
MAETMIESQGGTQPEPELVRDTHEPKGVLRKNLKPLIYFGAVLLLIVAAILSGTSKKPPAQLAAARHDAPQPNLQDNTDNNVQDMKNQTAAAKQKGAIQAEGTPGDPALVNATAAQQAAAAMSSPTGQMVPCVPGGACAPPNLNGQQQSGQAQISPQEQEAQQLAAKERELAYSSRFASNLVYTHQPDTAAYQQAPAGPEGATVAGYQLGPNPYTPASSQESSLVAPRAAGSPSSTATGQASIKRGPEVTIDSAVGQPYVIYEGLTMDTVLMNRLDGDSVGPVKVLVSNPVYSHDGQHVLVPEGTIVLGEAKKIGANGFGQQRRMAVTFHRMIMPDGYSVDLDQFHGLDQIGEEGLKDKVDNHYIEIFGTSIALGVIAGASEITQGGGLISTSGSQAFTTGAASGVSQSATTVLDRFIQIPPTITIREGHRVKVYFMQDMLLPAYENHTIPQTY